MAEGSETPGGDPPRSSEGDLLAERRARRAAESGDLALTRRAEAAEATVRTLEAHVASLQQRLSEAEDERRRMSQWAQAEQASLAAHQGGSVGDSELRRVKQREYAEQQLRVEAEERYIQLDRESRAEIDRLSRRLAASEREARELGSRLRSVQRELTEAEQAAAAERSAIGRAERELKERLADLERRAVEIQRGLEAERAARERSERLLESMREGHRKVEGLVGELRDVVVRMRAAALGPRAREHPARRDREPRGDLEPSGPSRLEQARRDEMAQALAAAVERLRARVEDVGGAPASAQEVLSEPSAPSPEPSRPVGVKPPPHKHSMSLLTRMRIRRKDRRERRSAAAEPPSMQSQ